jgi:hypothetical protein
MRSLPVPTDNAGRTQMTCPLEEILHGIRNYLISNIDKAIELRRSVLALSDWNNLSVPLVFGDILSKHSNAQGRSSTLKT